MHAPPEPSGSRGPASVRSPRARRLRRALGALALLGVSLGVALLGLELGLRAYHVLKAELEERRLPPLPERALVPSADPTLIYEFNPGWEEGRFSVNSHGMADDEVEERKPEGVFRIAFVGDSLSAGWGHTGREELYWKVLEQRLNRRSDGTRIESLNFGVNGYSILQAARTAETRALRFEPDVIVAQLCLNDPYPAETSYARVGPRHWSRLRDFFFLRLRPARFWAYSWVERHYDERGWANVDRGFRRFAELARRGPPVLAVLFPYLHRPAYEEWGFEAFHRGYAAAARAHGVPFLDLLEPFRRAGRVRDDGWPMDALHPTPEGNRIAAREIARELERLGWLPPLT